MRKLMLCLAVMAFAVGCSVVYKRLSAHGEALTADIEYKITHILSDKFNTPISIQSSITLSEPERRNLVVRIMIDGDGNDIPDSVIFKQSLPDPEKNSADDKKIFDRFAREWAGLEFVSSFKTEKKLVPQFYGGNVDSRFILFEDLGASHISLKNALVGNDPQEATKALQLFMQVLAQLHVHGYGRTEEYLAILKKINPTANLWQADLSAMQANMPSRFEEILKFLAMPYTQELQQEVSEVFKAVLAPGQFTTFIHGDCCPDNTFYDVSKNELLFIDFEWGYVRSALLDATYPRMSMPNCWGGDGTIPEGVIESLDGLYRQEIAGKIPAASGNAYYDAYCSACAYWMIKTAILIDQPEEVWPRVLSRLQAFETVVARYGKLPHLRKAVHHILQELKVRWPNAKPLELYPSYANKK